MQVGGILHDNGLFWCSPDGLIVSDSGVMTGTLELKNPTLHTQAKYVLAGELPPEYRAQTSGHMIVSGLPACTFLSYAPGLPPLLVDVVPDEFTVRLKEALDEFADLYDKVLKRLLGFGVEDMIRKLHPDCLKEDT